MPFRQAFEKGINIEEIAQSEVREEEKSPEDRGLDFLERLLEKGVTKHGVASGLAGLDSDRAWALRERLLSEVITIEDSVASGLSGLDSDRAWAMRERLLPKNVSRDLSHDGEAAALGLAGLDSKRAWALRERLLSSPLIEWGAVAAGLAGLDSSEAWAMRERVLSKGALRRVVALGLAGLNSPQAWEMRERLLSEGTASDWVARGLAGLDNDQAWAMRERLLAKIKVSIGMNVSAIVQSLAGVDSPRAWRMRESFLKGRDKEDVAFSLAGLNSPQAWAMREDLLADFVSYDGNRTDGLAQSVFGNYLMVGVRKAQKWPGLFKDSPPPPKKMGKEMPMPEAKKF